MRTFRDMQFCVCFGCLRPVSVCPIFPVPLGCSFLIAPSVFSYVCSLQRIQVYINKYTIFDLTILYFLQNKTALVIKSEAP